MQAAHRTPLAKAETGTHVDVPPLPHTEIPEALRAAVKEGKAIHFTTPAEDKQTKQEPDYKLDANGTLTKTNKKPSADGSITIEVDTKDSRVKNAFAEKLAATMKSENPDWYGDLTNGGHSRPDFGHVLHMTRHGYQAAPEHGFQSHGVRHHRGVHAFAHQGGFDSHGYFHGRPGGRDGEVRMQKFDAYGKPLEGGEKVQAREIYDYLIRQGLSPAAASGVLGNMMTESSLQTGAWNAGEGALGLCQWEKGRLGDLEQFARQQGKSVGDWRTQVDFMMHELQTKYTKAYSAIQHASSPAEAAAQFDRLYEISAGTSRGKRETNAQRVYNTFGDQPQQAVS